METPRNSNCQVFPHNDEKKNTKNNTMNKKKIKNVPIPSPNTREDGVESSVVVESINFTDYLPSHACFSIFILK